MRCLIALSVFAVLAAADNYPNATDIGKSLEEVYGPLAPVDEIVAWNERAPSRRALDLKYYQRRSADNCTFPMEVFIVQDNTASFTDNFKEMKDVQLQRMYDALRKDHPNSKFGVATHRDKPVWKLGDPKSDYCYRLSQPLSEGFDDLWNAYDKMKSTGGGDPGEDQFEAIIAAAESSESGWSDPLATRVIVVSTDAQPHHKDDGLNEIYHLKDYTGHYDQKNPDVQCREQYYPTPEMVKEAVTKLKAYVIVAVFDGEYEQPTRPIDDWRYFSSMIGEPDAFVVNVRYDTTDFWDRIAEAIRAIEEAECPPTTTTTPTTPIHTTTYVDTTTKTESTEPATTAALECECPTEDQGQCECPEVRLLLKEKPKHLILEIDN